MTMIATRLGHVLGWTANLIAFAIFVIFLAGVTLDRNPHNDRVEVILIGVFFVSIVWLVGRALQYILAGRD